MPGILGEALLALGISPGGIPFGGSGGTLTDVFFLICSTDDQGHLRSLARISRLLSKDAFLADLRAAEDAVTAQEIIRQYEQEVIFTGYREERGELLRTSDIFVMPSYSEGLSNALMEAMSSGCAPIATEVGGNCFLIQNGVSGFLFSPGDLEALRAHIRRLITDRDKRRAIAGEARKRMEISFSWEKVGEQYKELFGDL